MRLDLSVVNAQARTMADGCPRATRIGVWHGRVVGYDNQLDGLEAACTVDVGGRTVLPGFVDAHTHLVWQGLQLGAADVSSARGIDEALGIIASAAQRQRSGWLDVFGYDQRPLGRHLGADDLDRVCPGRKVYVSHFSGHACVVSGAVLREVPPAELSAGGAGVVRHPDGQPSGLFLESAQELARRRRLPYSFDEVRDAVVRAGRLCASQGVTFCAEAGTGGGLVFHSPLEPAAYQDAAETGELAVRAQLMVAGDFLHATGMDGGREGPSLGIDLGLRTGFGGSAVSIGAAKFWLDGGMSARTAAMSAPYTDGSGYGALSDRLAAYRGAVIASHRAGWQLALHAIGDLAVDAALDLVEAAIQDHPVADARPRIEHCGLVRPDQLARLGRNRVVAVVQPSFLQEFGDDYASIVGPERADWLYRAKSLLDHGVALAGSSDRPVTAGPPLAGVSFLATRRALSGHQIGAAEALDVYGSVRAYTTGAAFACKAEHEVGSLGVGKLADFVVLDQDPFAVAPAEITDIPVTATVLGGKATYDPMGLFP